MPSSIARALAIALVPCLCAAQTTAPLAKDQQLAAGMKLPVVQLQFLKPLDSAQLKVGDEVVAVPSDVPGVRTMNPGSKLIGHVTEAKARSKGDETSALGIVFDKLQLPHGRLVLLNGTIRALAPRSAQDLNSLPSTPDAPTPYPADNRISPRAAAVHSVNLGEATNRVVGIPGLQLDAGGVLTSSDKQVSLPAKTQFTLQATAR